MGSLEDDFAAIGNKADLDKLTDEMDYLKAILHTVHSIYQQNLALAEYLDTQNET